MSDVVLITGASVGVGLEIARLLRDTGRRLVLTARPSSLARFAAAGVQESDTVRIRPLDVTDRDAQSALVAEIERDWDGVDVLINNAGVEAGAKTYAMIDDDDWDLVMDTNLKGVWRLSKAYTLRQEAAGRRGGNIVMISSITDRRTIKGQFPYAVSKGALTRMTEVMALEAAKYGIRVNALAPGYILTDLSRLLLESDAADAFRKGIPMRRFGEFADLDGPLLLLASDASRYMTGSVVTVDGGHVCASL